jgi:uncharacterized protein (DUF1684 family)
MIVLLFLLIVSASCDRTGLGPAELPSDYLEELEKWKQNRVESLKDSTGWMRLAGMYWLEPGENRFGSGEEMDIQFPEGTIHEEAGTFIYDEGTVRMRVEPGVIITHGQQPVTDMVIFDSSNDAPRLEHGSLLWFVIARGDLVGIRLYNKENEKVDQFTGFESYPVDTNWVRKARYIPKPEGSSITVVNVLGQEMQEPSPATLEFSWDGEIYSLDAIDSDDDMFLIVGDETNQTETYQAGRYLYVQFPENGSEFTQLDFNKLYNPPCAYNLFTTCQLPPPQNRLGLAIPVGEKRPDEWKGLHDNE